jgi:signal transduction histidine kinase
MLLAMVSPRIGRPPIIGSVAALLTLSAVALALITVAEIDASLAAGDGPLWVVLVGPASVAVFTAVGVTAVWRRPNNHAGVIMLVGAATVAVANLPAMRTPSLTVASVVLATVTLGVLVHMLLAFPSGSTRSPAARRIVVAGYGVCLILQAPLYLFDPAASPGSVLAVADNPLLVTIGRWTQTSAGVAVMIAAAAVLAGRFRRADGAQRRVLGPLYLYGIVAVLAVPVIGSVLVPFAGMSSLVASILQITLVTLVPVGIGYAMLTGGFARTSDVQELGAWLSVAGDDLETLQAALARTLGDPSVRLAFWSAETGTFVDGQGRPLSIGARPGCGTVDVEASGHRVAVIEYDAALIDRPAPVAAAGQVVAVAIDRARIAAELRASRDELRESRARIVHAGDDERRRLAQDLHDCLQSRLVLLGIQAQALAMMPGVSAEVADAATAVRVRIDSAAAELRGLVHAVMPPALAADGLAAAVEDLLDRMPMPARLELHEPEAVAQADPHTQSTAYFVVAEGLTNAVKHSHATDIVVRMTANETRLLIDVIDNGIGLGYTDKDSAAMGFGLRSVSDRVSAVGGQFAIASPAGGGTHLTAELPCAS